MPEPGVTGRAPRRAALFGAALLSMQPPATLGQDTFEEWMLAAALARSAALEAIDLYIKRNVMSGVQMVLPEGGVGPCVGKTCQAVKIENVTLPDGTTVRHERLLSPMELGVLTGNTDPAFLEAMGTGFLMAQSAVNQGIGDRDPMGILGFLDEAYLAEGDVAAQMVNPTRMFGMGGFMMLQSASAARSAEESLQDSADLAQSDADQMYAGFQQLEYAGTQSYGSITASAYQTPDLNLPTQNVDGQEFALNSATILVDPETHRFLKHRMEGTATAEGQPRDFFIEIEFSDFRNPPGCGQMEEPYRRVMRMGGMLDEQQMAELEQARAELADFEQQMASMPADQRAMMEQMAGPQMEMMRGLVNSGAIEYVEETEDILCNPDLASLFAVGGEPESEAGLVRQIQEYLVILGYEPGNIEGVPDELTQIAISQFQAEQGLPVTGEPSAELAAFLAQLVEG